MHGQPCERLDISVAVMQTMNIFVQRTDMQKAMCEIKMAFSVKRDPQTRRQENECIVFALPDVTVRQVVDSVGRVAVYHDRLPHCCLEHTQEGV